MTPTQHRVRRLRPTLILGAAAAVAATLLLWRAAAVDAVPAAPLPAGNLIVNPWFRAAADPTDSGLDYWTDAAGLNKHWSSSQKDSNPSPDAFPSAVCGPQPTYCGTAARLSTSPGQSGGIAIPNVTAYLYQVVAADPTETQLNFFAHWVSHVVDPAIVRIYGGDSAGGPWTLVWQPFYHTQLYNPPPDPGGENAPWTHTGLLQTTLPSGYPHYKVEIQARLPQSPEATGFKITGVFFGLGEVDGIPPPPHGTPPPPPGALSNVSFMPLVLPSVANR